MASENQRDEGGGPPPGMSPADLLAVVDGAVPGVPGEFAFLDLDHDGYLSRAECAERRAD